LKSQELTDKLRSLYLRRTKDEVLKDALPMKDERIVFCEPSELQKLIYQHILEQPDFVLLRYVKLASLPLCLSVPIPFCHGSEHFLVIVASRVTSHTPHSL
jgi:SNF2 family DNA or RNA helicase